MMEVSGPPAPRGDVEGGCGVLRRYDWKSGYARRPPLAENWRRRDRRQERQMEEVAALLATSNGVFIVCICVWAGGRADGWVCVGISPLFATGSDRVFDEGRGEEEEACRCCCYSDRSAR